MVIVRDPSTGKLMVRGGELPDLPLTVDTNEPTPGQQMMDQMNVSHDEGMGQDFQFQRAPQ
jgi:hypothetical protein